MATLIRPGWLQHQQRFPAVHKWEKQWVSKGNMMIFKWVRTESRAGKGTLEENDVDVLPEDPTLAEGFLAEGGSRRLTRGKAADMGITVESIADTNDTLLARAAPGDSSRAAEKPRSEASHTPDGAQSGQDAPGVLPATENPSDPGAGTKRPREEGAEEGNETAKRVRLEEGSVEEMEAESARAETTANHFGPPEDAAQLEGPAATQEAMEDPGGNEQAVPQAVPFVAAEGALDNAQQTGGPTSEDFA